MFKKYKVVLLSIVFFLTAFNLYAGWTHTYGGTSWDFGRSVQQTSDGGYIVVGETESYGAGYQDIYLIKTDGDGNTDWSHTYGGLDNEFGNSVQQTSDGGYIIVGYTFSYGVGSTDVYLIKTDGNGNVSWSKTYGGTSQDYGNSVWQTSDGGYIITGVTESYGAGIEDVYLIKTDGNGNVSWSKTYGGTSYEYGNSVQQTSDGGYIIAGYTNSFGENFYLIKTDGNGDTTWTKTYGGTSDDYGCEVQQTSDGGYIIVGYTNSFGAGSLDAYLVKTDGNGNAIWDRTYGGTSYDYGYSVQQTSDGGYIIAGETWSYGAGSADVYLVKTDGNGNIIWNRTFGGGSDEAGNSVKQTSDGGYIIAGYTESYGAGYLDFYLIKTNANGSVAVEEDIISTPENFSYSINQISDNNIILQFSLPENSNVELNIYDASGRYISTPIEGFYSSGIHNINFKTDNNGVYFFSLKTEDFSENGKFIVF